MRTQFYFSALETGETDSDGCLLLTAYAYPQESPDKGKMYIRDIGRLELNDAIDAIKKAILDYPWGGAAA